MVDSSKHRHITPIALPSTDLDSDRARSSVGMGLTHHRKQSSQAIASRCRNSAGDALDAWKGRHQQKGVSQRTPVAIARSKRIREPHELTTRPPTTIDIRAVSPVDGVTAERGVVRPGTIGSTSTGFEDMNLFDVIEVTSRVSCENATQPGSHAGTDDDRQTTDLGFGAEIEKTTNVGNTVPRRHHMHPRLESSLRIADVRSGFSADDEHCYIERVRRPHLLSAFLHGCDDLGRPSWLVVPHLNRFDVGIRQQLAYDASPHIAEPNNANPVEVPRIVVGRDRFGLLSQDLDRSARAIHPVAAQLPRIL